MKKTAITIVLCMALYVGVFSQSAQKVSEMVNAQTVSLLDVSYFAATYLNVVESTTSEEYSLNALERYARLSKIKDEQSALTYKDFAYFCMQVWDIKGGLFFALSESPRYAFRELQTMNIIHPLTQPNEIITGVEALSVMTRIIEHSEYDSTIDLMQYVKMPMKFHIFNR